mmetsp:Transcript_73486/g.201816  ORF Transcript_73486/g.201816 Transcript_73486/m.201816 type:complete len:201 (+) Transcript_73486:427-1029(+)
MPDRWQLCAKLRLLDSNQLRQLRQLLRRLLRQHRGLHNQWRAAFAHHCQRLRRGDRFHLRIRLPADQRCQVLRQQRASRGDRYERQHHLDIRWQRETFGMGALLDKCSSINSFTTCAAIAAIAAVVAAVATGASTVAIAATGAAAAAAIAATVAAATVAATVAAAIAAITAITAACTRTASGPSWPGNPAGSADCRFFWR